MNKKYEAIKRREIQPTPILEGEDALKFIQEFVKANERMTEESVREAREKAFKIKFKVIE